MATNLRRPLTPNFVGDSTTVQFDLRDVPDGFGNNPINSPPLAVEVGGPPGVSLVSHNRFSVILLFTTPPGSAGVSVSLSLVY